MEDHPGRLKIVNQFRLLLETVRDDKDGMVETMDFLYEVMREKQGVLPITEMITVLKHVKPVLFQHLRRAVALTSRLNLVLQLDMNVEEAYRRLDWNNEEIPSGSGTCPLESKE
ncbi:hypothetical protein DUZ99_11100 [Xylanibacillus composti]|uniref:Uncharacterized protein n=1 Tax=Xylanibacillus composti TaxID=1572762 RepID=A0A8J4M1K3_9BACL|nr:hypothetical protein [Xylanibacillus composti]MDT9725517.1 hypothetical protein [Xylanibacillus composti]GIQ67611.1 hypothetical protein XYCOK13_04350 [Xylanibacillus composti]